MIQRNTLRTDYSTIEKFEGINYKSIESKSDGWTPNIFYSYLEHI